MNSLESENGEHLEVGEERNLDRTDSDYPISTFQIGHKRKKKLKVG